MASARENTQPGDSAAAGAAGERARKSGGFSLGVHPGSVQRLLWAAPVITLLSFFYLFVASAGTFRDLPSHTDYYDQMGEGFRAGHLYTRIEPNPALLASPSPFAFSNVGLWYWDASLYKGHYYLYWGPLPGLFLLVYKVLAGTHDRITDQWPTAILMLGRLYAGAALLLSLASRWRIRQPPWVCSLAIAVFALANPMPFIVSRPHVYEAALVGGQCFLFWGLVFAFWGIEKRAWRRPFFLLSSAAFAFAIGCRATMFIAAPLCIAVTLVVSFFQSNRTVRGLLLDALAIGVPFAVGASAYGAYNYARFDSVWEFGVHYQVTTQPFIGKSAYVVPNIFSYLLAPLTWSCRFPFVAFIGNRELSTLIDWPLGYQIFERVGGILRSSTWCWFLLLCFWRLASALAAFRRPLTRPSFPKLTWYEAWGYACSLGIIASMVPVLSLWEASMRYIGDALGGILLAATLAVFWLLQRSYSGRGRAFGWLSRALVFGVAAQTCLVGALCSFTYTGDDPMKGKNPALFKVLEEHLSLCPTRGDDHER